MGNRPIEPKALEVEFFPIEEVLHEKSQNSLIARSGVVLNDSWWWCPFKENG
jgi:hypothetical protein